MHLRGAWGEGDLYRKKHALKLTVSFKETVKNANKSIKRIAFKLKLCRDISEIKDKHKNGRLKTIASDVFKLRDFCQRVYSITEVSLILSKRLAKSIFYLLLVLAFFVPQAATVWGKAVLRET